MFICVYIYTHMYSHIHIHMYTHTYLHTQIQTLTNSHFISLRFDKTTTLKRAKTKTQQTQTCFLEYRSSELYM